MASEEPQWFTPRLETGPFVLKSLLEDVPLSAEGDSSKIKINCVEYYDSNLYVGTSASEILHFVQIPPDPSDLSSEPSYILASRLEPAYLATATLRPGVQQILLLTKVSKAMILCNNTVTFYSLPELSPVFGPTQVQNCKWIGGLDLNEDQSATDWDGATVTVLLSLRSILRRVKIGVKATGLRPIDFVGSTLSVRRDSFACVADSTSYSLLDVDRQLRIPLFPISSLDDSESVNVGGQAEDISGGPGSGSQRSTSATRSGHSPMPSVDRGHDRSASLGNMLGQARSSYSGDRSGRGSPDRLFRDGSPAPALSPGRSPGQTSPSKLSTSPEKPLPPAPNVIEPPPDVPTKPPAKTPITYLKPHIVSPSPQEFLLVTGTEASDPGVGIFVNLEGDVTRSTLEFERYPEALVADGRGIGINQTPNNSDDDEEGYVLAALGKESELTHEHGLEIQRWDLDPGDGPTQKYWLPVFFNQGKKVEQPTSGQALGIRSVTQKGEVGFEGVIDRLRQKRFQPFADRSGYASSISLQSVDSRTATSVERQIEERELFDAQESAGNGLPAGWEEARNRDELKLAQRVSRSKTRLVVWSHNKIWWAVRNPLAIKLDAELGTSIPDAVKTGIYTSLDRRKIVETINSLRGREAKSETEFVSLEYIRNRAGLVLLISLISISSAPRMDSEDRIAEEALLDGSLDPRVIISLVPQLRQEVVEGKSGIWIHGGVADLATSYIQANSTPKDGDQTLDTYVLHFFRRYLTAWRRRKGFGSVASEHEVFRSVDASLLVVLLELDKSTSPGPARSGSVRAELNELVDHGLDSFDRAVRILESYQRLYVLSRLYQSRKMSGEVLSTWRRIIEGAKDIGGELSDGEQVVRSYLLAIRNQNLVQEYGVWLASRNPQLGIQVFSDERSRVKFPPDQVVDIFRHGAPAAVKDYLEHLVFAKGHSEYVNELIAYYLDIVLNTLETSEEAREILGQSYENYRALQAPKPTYRQFITDNAIPTTWWHSRLRLLQLLGGSHGSASEYDVAAILERIGPFTQELVPEVIILGGRQGNHEDAIKLLTHGLGDYDTAINYCLLGGSSIYHPTHSRNPDTLPTRSEQSQLFNHLLSEFLQIEDISDRVEQTGSLLERFGSWFDVGYVLSVIPDTWSVELVSGFLVSALRRIVRERSESMIVKALSSSQNLKTAAELIEGIEKRGPEVEAEG